MNITHDFLLSESVTHGPVAKRTQLTEHIFTVECDSVWCPICEANVSPIQPDPEFMAKLQPRIAQYLKGGHE